MVDTKTPETTRPGRRKGWAIPIAVLLIFGLAVGGGIFWFFSGNAPDEVDLSATASAVAVDSGTTTESSTTGAAIDGTWVVDTTVGDFTMEDTTTATFVGFRVDEVLNSIGSTTAVGRTPEVSGSVTIDGTVLESAEVTADMTAIVSDESRREDSIQSSLSTSTHPTATFALTEPVDLGDGLERGDAIDVVAVGDLTINGVTNEVEVELEAQLVDGGVLVAGSTDVVFSDYDVTTPSSPIVLSVEDNGTIEIQLWLTR